MRYLILILPLIFFSCISNSGPSTDDDKFELIKTIGGDFNDGSSSIINTSDGGFIITGSTNSNDGDFEGLNKGNSDIVIIKFNANGGIQWINTYGGTLRDDGLEIIETSDNGYLITGSTSSNDGDFAGINKGSTDVFLLKIDSFGEMKWIKTFGGSRYEVGLDLFETTNNSYVITGYSYSNDGDFDGLNNGNNDIFIINIDLLGNPNWIKLYGGSSYETGFSIVESNDGDFVITGHYDSNDGDFEGLNKGDYDIFALKVNSNGIPKWLNSYGGSSHEIGQSIIKSSDNNYLITGYSNSDDGDFEGLNKGDFDSFVLKIDTSGKIIWTNTFGGSESDFGNSLIKTSNAEYVLTGHFRSNDGDFDGRNKGNSDVYFHKINSSGQLLTTETVGGDSDDIGFSICELSNSIYLITGFSSSNNEDFDELNNGASDIFIFSVGLN